jgi:glycosyltransferase involved in cell wall biosynthesis
MAPEPVPPTRPDAKPILLVAQCGVAVRENSILVDRKFHTGVLEYLRRIDRRIACLLPRMTAEGERSAVDLVQVPRESLPYELHVVSGRLLTGDDLGVVAGAVRESSLAYIGITDHLNFAVSDACRALHVPYVAVSEYTLRTEQDILRATTPSLARRAVRGLRLRADHARKLELVANACEVHANGYPTFHELEGVHRSRILFFDTRAMEADVVPERDLEARLATRASRPPVLIFSGRYHPMKGALDAVDVGIELFRRGLDFRLELFGTGPLRPEMDARVRRHGAADRIRIHDPIPYKPDLVARTREADLFLGCNVQGDPSCTYLETLSCGVPIVGYANEMWSPLCRESSAGVSVRARDVRALADAAWSLLADPERLRKMSLSARSFALEHSMERAWDLRTARLRELSARADAARVA